MMAFRTTEPVLVAVLQAALGILQEGIEDGEWVPFVTMLSDMLALCIASDKNVKLTYASDKNHSE
jgi:hypothetical protein